MDTPVIDASSFAGDVIDPRHAGYEKLRMVWNGLHDKRPDLILQPRTAADVQAAIRLAVERGMPLAVRGGGHSLPGFSTCDKGVVLDLSRLNHVEIDPAKRFAEVGGGALLGDLDRAGSPFGLVTPAGVVSHTGVGGLTLGGGMGWLSRRFGMTVDNLVAAEICLADGTLLTADADTHPELFWALRGGGGNFGVVTRFFFRMHPLGRVCVGAWDYDIRQIGTVLKKYRDLAGLAPRQVTSSFTASRTKFSVTAFASDGLSPSEIEAFGQLSNGAQGGITGMSFLELQSRADDIVAWGRRYYTKGGFFAELGDAAIETIAQAVSWTPSPDVEVYALQLGGAVKDIDEAATAYAGRAAEFYWIANAMWNDPAEDPACMAWGRETARRLTLHSAATNYVNEQSDSGIAQSAYGAEKFARLAAIKRRYDPMNVFRLNQNIAP
jgi:FAD/FMN-containing dehydrogenase